MPTDSDADGSLSGDTASVENKPMRVAIGIATRGRPAVLAGTIAQLKNQTISADKVVVCYTEERDLGPALKEHLGVIFTRGEAGLTRQRNQILQMVHDCDLILFIDDDFYLHSDYLKVTLGTFKASPKIVVTTGRVLADGIHGPGITPADARHILSEQIAKVDGDKQVSNIFNAYGCNMSLRLAPIRENHLRFDERLPLYGWWEDVDFSRQLGRYGKVVKLERAMGVHLGSKSGRTPGARLGYSQVANPVYLAVKGTLPWAHAVVSVTRRFLRNAVLSLGDDPHVDRRGRLRGNLIAFGDLVRGRLSPEGALNC